MLNILKRNVYLDNNATTCISRPVRQAMNRALRYHWGNPSAGYQKGKTAHNIIEKARVQVAKAIHAHAHEIYFSSCATEANNAVIKTLSNHFYPQKKKIISTPIEHPSVINTLEYLQSRGIIVEYCPVDRHGFVSIQELENMIDDQTFLVCCIYANNEIGTIQNITEIIRITKAHKVLVLADCVQALGKVPVDVKAMGVDYATFSAHKLHGPKGVGALYARISSHLEPFIHGGHQEEGMRAGTESVHNIAGFGKACQDVEKLISHSGIMGELKDFFIDELRKIKPDLIINSPIENCLANSISVTLPNIKSKELMLMLDYYSICVSGGSACSTHIDRPSHVLKAIGLSDKAAEETIRISLGKDSTKSDIRYTINKIGKYLNYNM
jgi:cysteine desulfurase